MTQEPPSNTPPADGSGSNQTPPAGSGSSPFRVFETKEQYEAALNRKLANFVPKTEIDKLNQLIASKNGEIQIWQQKATGYESELANYRLGELRQKIGREAGLPADWIEELKGADEAAIKAHAEILRKKLGIKQNAGGPVPPGAQNAPPNGFNEAILKAVGIGGR